MLSEKEEQLLQSNQPVFGRWHLLSVIGEGSSGTVYEIADEEGNKGALKVIPVSLEDVYFLSAPSDADNHTSANQSYMDELTSEIMAEIKVMDTLKNKTGIMGYEEYDILENTSEEPSFRLILIRMELMQPLNKILRLQESDFPKQEVLKLGMDLLSALIECKKQNIVHRDIKPANIFVTQKGRYLLGDFGCAKLLEKTMMASHKGTLAYMAPEIAAGQSFHSSVDLYSLGLLMYQLLNKHRLPFLGENFKFSDIEAATEKRLNGVPLPPPLEADEALGAIICKMCAFSPKDRFSSPKECRAALEAYIYSEKLNMEAAIENAPNRKNISRRATFQKAAFLGVVLLSCMIFFLYWQFRKTQQETSVAGITCGNVFSSGMVAGDGTWLYASQDSAGERGYKISSKTGEKVVLCDYIMHDINLAKDFIIFSSEYTLDAEADTPYTLIKGLYRMDYNGENLTCLEDEDITNPVAYDDYVYYIKPTENENLLCRIPMEGGSCETLTSCDKSTYHFYVYDGKIYVYDPNSRKLIRLELDGTNQEIVIDHALSKFCMEDDNLYFILSDLGTLNTVYSFDVKKCTLPIDINSHKVSKAKAPAEILEFQLSQGNIYFSMLKDEASKEGIWCMTETGDMLEQLYSGAATNLQIVNGMIYFYEDQLVYRIDLHGNEFTLMEDISVFYGMK